MSYREKSLVHGTYFVYFALKRIFIHKYEDMIHSSIRLNLHRKIIPFVYKQIAFLA